MQVFINLNQPPSRFLYCEAKKAAILAGTSLNRMAKQHGITGNNLKQILVGAWSGEKASNVMNDIINDLTNKLKNKGE